MIFAKGDIAVPVPPPATVIAAETPLGVAHVPAHVGTAISKTIHYAETPLLTGYASTLYKPNLGAFDSALKFNHQQRYLRPVKTLVPKVPLLTTVNEMEIHPQILPEIRVVNPANIYYPPVIAPLIR